MIRYEVNSQRIGDSEDYDSTLIIFQDDREIMIAREGSCLEIDGDFRNFVETGKTDKEGVPEVKHKGFSLSSEEIFDLYRIISWWDENKLREPEELKYVLENEAE